ncbi:hypothetical protein CIB84_001753, partial [Bambusicola thoracicus]
MAAGGSLRGRSLPELREMLRRQERLLADRKFIDKLPDKGKKISDFAKKLMCAISQEEEVARTAELLSAVRLEFQAEQDKARAGTQCVALSEHTLHQKDPTVLSDGSRAEEVPETASQGRGGERLGQEPT